VLNLAFARQLSGRRCASGRRSQAPDLVDRCGASRHTSHLKVVLQEPPFHRTPIGTLREEAWLRGRLRSRIRAGKAEAGVKFADYFDLSAGSP
jgi:hypothetical protein